MLILKLDEQFTQKYFKLPFENGSLKDVEFLIRFIGKKEQDASRSKWFKNSKSGNPIEGIDFQVMSSERSIIACKALVGWREIKTPDGVDVPFNEANKEKIVDALFTLPIEKVNDSDVSGSNTIQSWVFEKATNFENFITDTANL